MALNAAMYRALRTGPRPPRMCRWPWRVPESSASGATPTSLAIALAVELAQLRQIGEELVGGAVGDAGDAGDDLAAAVQSSSPSISSAMARSRSSICWSISRSSLWPWRRASLGSCVVQAVFLGHAHLHQGAAPGDQVVQLGLFCREFARGVRCRTPRPNSARTRASTRSVFSSLPLERANSRARCGIDQRDRDAGLRAARRPGGGAAGRWPR